MTETERIAIEMAKAVLAFDRAVRAQAELQRDDPTYIRMVGLANRLLINAQAEGKP